MYKKFYGLKENPFNVTPDPRYLFPTGHTDEALACLTYGVLNHKGFILLTGEVGTGKTTLLNKLLESLRQQGVATAFVFNTRFNVPQFFDYVLADFGLPREPRLKSQMLLSLNQWLLDRFKAGSTTALLIDEAHNVSSELLEEIRLLTNLETSTEKLLQIVLSGQPELEHKLRRPDLRQLRQRITLRTKTYPLAPEETRQYIAQRLKVAGSDGRPVFTPEAVELIHRYARGIPRVINTLCEHALISGYADQRPVLGTEVIQEVAKEFELDRIDPMSAPPGISAEEWRRRQAMQNAALLMGRFRRSE
jgi:general secretion pathway protein A